MALEADRLPEDQVLAQLSSVHFLHSLLLQLLIMSYSTLLFAATDTASNALMQILQILAENPDVQDRLRTEVQKAEHNGEISYDELISLPYMDAVCRETLRL